MDKLNREVGDARRRIAALTGILRWMWVGYTAITVVAITHTHYTVAAFTGLGCLFSLIAAAVGRHTIRRLDDAMAAAFATIPNRSEMQSAG